MSERSLIIPGLSTEPLLVKVIDRVNLSNADEWALGLCSILKNPKCVGVECVINKDIMLIKHESSTNTTCNYRIPSLCCVITKITINRNFSYPITIGIKSNIKNCVLFEQTFLPNSKIEFACTYTKFSEQHDKCDLYVNIPSDKIDEFIYLNVDISGIYLLTEYRRFLSVGDCKEFHRIYKKTDNYDTICNNLNITPIETLTEDKIKIKFTCGCGHIEYCSDNE